MVQARSARQTVSNDAELAQRVEDLRAQSDDALSADEERFVAAFVEYWTRRGAELVRIQA